MTLGTIIGGVEIVFKNTIVSAECGMKTAYKVVFNYTDIESNPDGDDCQKLNGNCIFPSYEDDIIFSFAEYTNTDYNVKVTAENRAKLAGETIFLKLQPLSIKNVYKFAVTECHVTNSRNESFMLFNPGAVNDPKCDLDAIDLVAGYDSGSFYFQHVLFLFSGVNKRNTYTLDCSVEVCDKTDGGSTGRFKFTWFVETIRRFSGVVLGGGRI